MSDVPQHVDTQASPGAPGAPRIEGVERLLIVMPTWLGDCVMATPTLRALRTLYSSATITALLRPTVKPILEPCPWVDAVSVWDRSESQWRTARRLARERFDMAVLLPNSLRSALLARMAGVPRRVGYARDGRGLLLTDRLRPKREGRQFARVSTLLYYLDIARYLGAVDPSPRMELFTSPDADARADAMLVEAGYDAVNTPGPLVLLTPGANYGDAKLWPAERFAAVADQLITEHGATVALSGSPAERPILDAVASAARSPLIDLTTRGLDLSLLKSVVRRCALVVTNDTGPRHVAAAMGVPVVTLFGPTDPAWTVIDFSHERQVRIDVDCGPCQKKQCPLAGTPEFHKCMTGVSVEMVVDRCGELMAADGRR